MSDRTWYLFGEALKRDFEKLAREEQSWFNEHKRLDDMGLHADNLKDFGEKKDYWKAYVDGYKRAMGEASNTVDLLYKKLGMDEG